MRGQLAWLQEQGFNVAVAAAPGPELDAVARDEGVAVYPVPLTRRMSPLQDLRALWRLVGVMGELRPEIVNAATPKGGLLGTVAARVTKVPTTIHTLRGLRSETLRGVRGHLVRGGETLTCAWAHSVVAVSETLKDRAVKLGIVSARRIRCVGPGSSNGVDTHRFRPASESSRRELRRRLRIPATCPVVGFVGRLTRDKGIEDLAEAFFDAVLPAHPGARLLLLGDFEGQDRVASSLRRLLQEHPRVVLAGFVEDPSPYYGVMDSLAFPSYREGFPNVPLEAAACGIPVVGYRATGTLDAVCDQVTGTLCELGDRRALGLELCRYLADPGRRQRHGEAGRRRACERFDRERVWAAWLAEYRRLLTARGRREPSCGVPGEALEP